MSFDYKKVLKPDLNVGEKEKQIRLYVGIGLVILSIFTAWVIALVVGLVLIATGYLGRCPAYAGINYSSADKGDAEPAPAAEAVKAPEPEKAPEPKKAPEPVAKAAAKSSDTAEKTAKKAPAKKPAAKKAPAKKAAAKKPAAKKAPAKKAAAKGSADK